MKEEFTILLPEVIQHQVELQAGFEAVIRQAKQCGNAQSAQALQGQMEHFNARVTAFASSAPIGPLSHLARLHRLDRHQFEVFEFFLLRLLLSFKLSDDQTQRAGLMSKYLCLAFKLP